MQKTGSTRREDNRFAPLIGLVTGSGVVFGAAPAYAAQPEPWGLDLQPAASIVMEHLRWFEDFTLIIMTLIVLFVLGLLIYVCVKFSEKNNPEPSRVTHNTLLEVAWTVIPIIILVVIAVPSFRLLYLEATIPEADMTVKTTGYQWFWGYEYPDHGGISFEQIMLRDEERLARIEETGGTEADFPRLLAVDYDMVVPVNATVRLQVTAADVLHAFAIPAFGLKMDAVPGRLNETWFRADREGIYYGQCSELCGTDHAFMPIAIRVVSQDQFDTWAAAAVEDIDQASQVLAQMLREAENQQLAQNQ